MVRMQKKILDLLDTYCNAEIADFRCHQLYTELSNMANELGYHLECGHGRSLNDRDCNVYLYIHVYNQNKETVEVFDEGELSASTELVVIDRKERIRFFSWDDEDFVDSIHWMIRILQKIKCSKNG